MTHLIANAPFHTSTRPLASSSDMLRTALPAHLERLAWNQQQIAAHQSSALRTLLLHAITHSPFHAARLAGIDPDHFELADLPRLPTMTKRDMMASFGDVVTDRRLNRQLVEDHIARTGADVSLLFGEYVVLTSGGSSGERGVFVYSLREAADLFLALVRPSLKRFLANGEFPPGGMPTAMVKARSAIHATRAFACLFSGDLMALTSVPVTQPLTQIVDQLNALHPAPVLLIGYPSVLDRLAEEKNAGRLRIAPVNVISASEQLESGTRARIRNAFGVGVVNGFGCTEGMAGGSAPDDEVIVLASDLSIIELVDQANRPVAPGTPSAKVLVTNLFNLTQPLIRYELNDSFVAEPNAEGHGHLRVRVNGRADQVLRFDNVVVEPHAIRGVLLTRPEIREYQVAQTPDGVHVTVVTPGGELDRQSLGDALMAALRAAGLRDAKVSITSADALEPHPDTGKVRRFIPFPAGV